MTRVKICGISTFDDGQVALDEGAEFLGFVFYPPSHRFIEPDNVAGASSSDFERTAQLAGRPLVWSSTYPWAR